ncbi:MAG: helix-turn-helix domain-containing protein [Oscillospiraceae bacterium]|nr:helix-turn-helix domain-containing protein [Oscillospiraceae bacterium]
MTFGCKLQVLRKKSGLSQEQLAEQLNVSRQSISKWELSESMPDSENLIKLTTLFSVTADYLLKDEHSNNMDIPIVKANAEHIKLQYRDRWIRIISLVSFVVGSIGAVTMYIVSTIVLSKKWIPDTLASAEFDSVLENLTSITPNANSQQLYRIQGVRGNLWAFLQTYHLETLFALFCALTLMGIAMLCFGKHSRNLKRYQNEREGT